MPFRCYYTHSITCQCTFLGFSMWQLKILLHVQYLLTYMPWCTLGFWLQIHKEHSLWSIVHYYYWAIASLTAWSNLWGEPSMILHRPWRISQALWRCHFIGSTPWCQPYDYVQSSDPKFSYLPDHWFRRSWQVTPSTHRMFWCQIVINMSSTYNSRIMNPTPVAFMEQELLAST